MPGGTCTSSYLTLLKSRDEALVHSAHHLTSIEGNPLSLEEVADLIAGREMTAATLSPKDCTNDLTAPHLPRVGKAAYGTSSISSQHNPSSISSPLGNLNPCFDIRTDLPRG